MIQELMNLVCDYDVSKIEEFCDNDNAFYKVCITEPEVIDSELERLRREFLNLPTEKPEN